MEAPIVKTNKAADELTRAYVPLTSTPSVEATIYPLIQDKIVYLRPRINKAILPEVGTLINTAEDYTQILGSSFVSYNSNVLLGRTIFDKATEAKYMTELIGTSPTHTEWDKLLNEYWANFYLVVPISGVKLNVGMLYADANDKGTPLNVRDYVIWCYAQKHSWVANTIADVNNSNKIKFYLWSQGEDNVASKRRLDLEDKATLKRMEICRDRDAARSVLLVLNLPVPSTDDDLFLAIADAAKRDPAKFLDTANDKALTDKAFVEKVISTGIFMRPINSTIVMYDGVAIGSSVAEVVGWLNKNENSPTKEMLKETMRSHYK